MHIDIVYAFQRYVVFQACSKWKHEKIEKKNPRKRCVFGDFGVSGGIRTHDLSLRRRSLYPAELRGLIHFYTFSIEP